MAKARQIRSKHPSEVRNAAVSFVQKLESDELLTGSPTVTSSPSGLTIASEKVNTVALTVDGEEAAIGQAVQFRVSGGTSGATYEITVSCATTASPAQTLYAECLLTVLDS